jgi:ribosomal protein S18 acetylase RimI-like enzyme
MESLSEMDISLCMSENIGGKFAALTRQLPDMRLHHLGSLQCVDCGRQSDTFNTIFGMPRFQEDIASVTQYYSQRNLPASWWFSKPLAVNVSESLRQAGWVHEETDVGMFLSLTTAVPVCAGDALTRIELCDSLARFQDFGLVLSAIFKPSNSLEAKNICSIYQKAGEHCSSLDERLVHLVGYLEEVPVSTASLYLKNNIAGIFDIATPETWRRRGFGSEMFFHALQLAQRKRAKICVLQASPDGLNIYKRAGFKVNGAFNVWNLRNNH